MTKSTTNLWGGRFKAGPSEALTRLSRSHPTFFRLFPEDIMGSQAHALELERAGILTNEEATTIKQELAQIQKDIESGEVVPGMQDEDVHSFLERILMLRLGALGGKLRAGRSRNDQTSNNTRLYLRRMAREVTSSLIEVQEALAEQAETHVETILPGFTHLQPAQPVSLGHHLMAHAQSIQRDIQRFEDWDKRFNTSPLGAAALAGSAIACRPEMSAIDLGYTGPCENSIDAVASRDHVAEFLFICSTIGISLSRLSEEIIIWSSKQFNWTKLHDSYSTGSSIMPQKKNPDIAELTRGMSGSMLGNLTGFLATMKAMPLAYNRDLAEDKRALFSSIDLLELILPAFAGMVKTLEFNVERLRADAGKGFTLATEVADWLASNGVPFSEAHEITGVAVRYCEERNIDLTELTAEDLPHIDSRLLPDVLNVIDLDKAISSRIGYFATAPVRVREQIARFNEELKRSKLWALESLSHSKEI